MTRTPFARRHVYLVALGLGLRLPGLLFNGQPDVFEMILDWGLDVRAVGLARGFSVNYGLFSFGAFGLAAFLGENLPRFWWVPYKVLVILFDTAVLAALLRLCGRTSTALVLTAYWLNPWFLWHGAYQGFWESPLLLFAILAALALRDLGGGARAWFLAGVLLFVSWQVKPQGLIHFAGPIGLLLTVSALRRQAAPLVSLAGGFLAASASVSVLLWLSGGSPFGLLQNLRTALEVMPVLSAGGLGLWRFVAFMYMQAHQIPGEVHQLHLPASVLTQATLISVTVCAGLLVAFALRLTKAGGKPIPLNWASFYLMLVAGALVLSQFGVRSHLNHTYGAMVLLVPLLPTSRRLRLAWIAGVVVQGVAHVTRYGAGTTALLPSADLVTLYGNADGLASRVRLEPAAVDPDVLLILQDGLNRVLGFATPDVISVLGLAMPVAAVFMLSGLFRLAPDWIGSRSAAPSGHH